VIWFTNLNDAVVYPRQYTLTVVTPVVPGQGAYDNLPVVFFPTNTQTSYVLQTTGNPASGNWMTVTNGVPFTGLTVPAGTGTAFFRLAFEGQIVTQIAAGAQLSLFLKDDGSLWGMGDDSYGELGNAFINYIVNIPFDIISNSVTTVSAGNNHSLFLKNDGSLWTMGGNQYGELGAGFYSTNSPYGFFSPQEITASNTIAISGGGGFSLFLKNDGTVWGMGMNDSGQLGDGTYNQTDLPVQMMISNVIAIAAAGGSHSLMLKTNGSLWAVGEDNFGQLGDGNSFSTTLPEQIVASNVTAIAAGGAYSLFIKKDGSLWVMGANDSGQLGDGTYNQTNRPEQIVTNHVTAIATRNSTSLFLKSDGSLWVMGANDSGQLGDGTYNQTNRPEQIEPGNVMAIAAGGFHSLFVKNDGSLWSMGANDSGQLGDDTYIQTNRPIQVTSTSNPLLGMTSQNHQPMIYFPTAAAPDYILQMTTNLASGTWTTVTNPVSFSGLQITNAPSPAYFRLY